MSESQLKRGYDFSLIEEKVANDDLFKDRTHERLAQQIYDLIRSAVSAVTLGLEGGWGAGKSTVVALLRKKLAADTGTSTFVFYFDAWAHDGDPLRRIFLESLIQEIDPNSCDSVLREIRSEVAGRKKKVTTHTSTRASKLGRWIALSALMLPFGAALISATDYSVLVSPLSEEAARPNVPFITGLLFSLSPMIVLFIWRFFGTKSSETNRPEFNFLESEYDEISTQDIAEDGERTSLEFEYFFKKILTHVQSGDSDLSFQRFLFVIDNLDRVSTGQARSIWATLQTFLQHRNSNGDRGGENVWFLVPYDPEGIRRLWAAPESGASESDTVAQSFIEKNFQAVFDVPEPVMSSWHEYSEACAEKALHGWPSSERQKAVEVYQIHQSKLDTSPTPRQMQRFYNQLGILGARWGGLFLTESLAIYVLLRLENTSQKVRQLLLDSEVPTYLAKGNEVERINSQIAGVLFGVGQERGVELLLGPIIRGALNAGDAEELAGLVRLHGSAFWIAWRALSGERSGIEKESFKVRLSMVKALSGSMSEYVDNIFEEVSALRDAFTSSSVQWNLGEEDCALYMAKLLDLVSDSDVFLSECHEATKRTIQITLKEEAWPDATIRQLDQIAQFLFEQGKSLKTLQYHVMDHGRWNEWTNVQRNLGIKLDFIWPNKQLLAELGGLPSYGSTKLDDEVLDILVRSTEYFPNKTEWEDIAKNLITWAQRGNHDMGSNTPYELFCCMISRCNLKTRDLLVGSLNNANFWNRAGQENLDDVPSLLGLSALIHPTSVCSATHIPEVLKDLWKKDGNETSLKLFQHLKSLDKLDVLWTLTAEAENRLAATTIRKNRDEIALYSKPAAIIELKNSDVEWSSEELSHIVDMAQSSGIVSEAVNLISENAVEEGYALYIIYKYAKGEARSEAENVLRKITTEQWVSAFEDDSYVLNAMLLFDDKPIHQYSDALKSHFESAVNSGKSTTNWVWKNFKKLIGKAGDVDLTLEHLTKAYFDSSGDRLEDKGFETLAPYFQEHISMTRGSLVFQRLCDWIDSRMKTRLEWVIDLNLEFAGQPTDALVSRLTQAREEEGEIADLSQLLIEKFRLAESDDDKSRS